MSYVMMQLGSFQFAIWTAAFQEFSRSTQWRWPEQETFGQLPTSQFTGKGKESITLKGVIFPEFRGGFGQIQRLRSLGDMGQPHMLVSGEGALMGRWCIEQLDEGQTIFDTFGRPRRQEFTLQLKRFS